MEDTQTDKPEIKVSGTTTATAEFLKAIEEDEAFRETYDRLSSMMEAKGFRFERICLL